ncbi:MAG: tetratricopeptide repeat protein [Deltaproteobacteria bacterium]|nr:tetratricopeptide repeat protein [Deltaproteobacteria bacterium]
MRLLLAWTVLGCFSLAPLLAGAAPKPKAKSAPVDPARADFEKGMRYYEAQEYEAALPYFERAYELSGHRASTIRALAQCQRSLKNYARAIELFREYLATQPKDRAAVEETVALLEPLRDQQDAALKAKPRERGTGSTPPIGAPGASSSGSATPTPPVSTPRAAPEESPTPPIGPAPPPPPPVPEAARVTADVDRGGPSLAPWLVIGGTAAVAITGGVLLGVGKSDASSVENAPQGTAFSDVSGAADRAPVLMTTGTILIGVGVAGAAAGVWWLLSSDDGGRG